MHVLSLRYKFGPHFVHWMSVSMHSRQDLSHGEHKEVDLFRY